MPTNSLSTINTIARFAVGFAFIYHGLVPKLLLHDAVEVVLCTLHHLDASIAVPLAGVFEVILGIAILVSKKTSISLYAAMASLIGLLIDIAIINPALLGAAFNPVSTNLALMALCLIAVMTSPDNS